MTTAVPYETYRPSEDRWLGDIPAHWGTPAISRLARIRNGSDYKHVETDDEGGFPVIGSGGPFARSTEFLYDRETVLLGRKGTIDRPLYWNGPFWAVDTMFYTEIGPDLDSKFFYYFATHIDFGFFSTNTALPSMSGSDIRAIRLAHPPLDEQRQIAEYLDRETGKIDELITKHEQLVDRLQQRHRSAIFRLVTKGINPSAPLKTAPFIWWGEIPEHWTMPKVSFHYSVVLGKMLDAARSEKPGDVLMPYVRAGNIQEAGLELGDLNEMPFSPDEVAALDLRKGDLLVVEGGAVGVNYLISEPIENVSFQKTVNRVRALDRSSTRFLGYALDVLRFSGVIDMLCNKSTIAHLTADKLGRINIPYPPVGEQEKIVELLELETAKLDQLASSARNVINVLHERRAALISAAVTGKIDVRGL